MQYDVIVIGGGTAGLVTASGCARLGRKVALIEREALGGDCLWTGCVPTKALVATARLAHQMRHADAWGLDAVAPRIDARAVMQSMRAQRRTISRHDDPAKFRALGIDVVEGRATFVGGRSLDVDGRRLSAKDVVIATGGRTAIPPVEGLDGAGWLDHSRFLAQDAIPSSVLILGGGPIGIEFAQLFARFGSRVTVVEMLDEILAKEDAAVTARMRRILEGEGIEIVTAHSVGAVRREGARKIASLKGKDGTPAREIAVDEIFVASGRRGNVEDLGLESAGVAVERSWVVADRFLRTTAPRVWACGDVHGGLQFTHVAAFEAVKVVRNMLFPGKSPVDYSSVPWAVYTDPEIAHLGMTETEARAAHDGVRVFEIEMRDVDRAVVDRADSGLVKLVCDARGSVLGAHAICTNASSVIQEVVLAKRKRMRVSELARRISAYPSLSDGVQKAAALFYQEAANGWLGSLARRIAAWSQ